MSSSTGKSSSLASLSLISRARGIGSSDWANQFKDSLDKKKPRSTDSQTPTLDRCLTFQSLLLDVEVEIELVRMGSPGDFSVLLDPVFDDSLYDLTREDWLQELMI